MSPDESTDDRLRELLHRERVQRPPLSRPGDALADLRPRMVRARRVRVAGRVGALTLLVGCGAVLTQIARPGVDGSAPVLPASPVAGVPDPDGTADLSTTIVLDGGVAIVDGSSPPSIGGAPTPSAGSADGDDATMTSGPVAAPAGSQGSTTSTTVGTPATVTTAPAVATGAEPGDDTDTGDDDAPGSDDDVEFDDDPEDGAPASTTAAPKLQRFETPCGAAIADMAGVEPVLRELLPAEGYRAVAGNPSDRVIEVHFEADEGAGLEDCELTIG